jgi:hypothetical protein
MHCSSTQGSGFADSEDPQFGDAHRSHYTPRSCGLIYMRMPDLWEQATINCPEGCLDCISLEPVQGHCSLPPLGLSRGQTQNCPCYYLIVNLSSCDKSLIYLKKFFFQYRGLNPGRAS